MPLTAQIPSESPGGFKPSDQPPITATGMQGFLKWLQREQPVVYQQIAPQVQAQFPRVFSDYNQSMTQAIRSRAANAGLARRYRMRGGLSGLGQGDMTDTYMTNPNLTINVASLTGDGSDAPIIDTSSPAFNLQTPAIDTADAANTSPGTATGTTNAIASMVAGITGLYTTVNQQQTANAITQLQLQRAQQGLSPLNIGMNANGIPTIAGLSAGSSSMLLIGVAAIAALFLFGGKKASA